ncbi:MAG TPA: V-type ATP synthase subunit E family protein [Atribacterota bacterium]|nr:V-type ATP synthase subunit E family protein [Atribacterota bacterium]
MPNTIEDKISLFTKMVTEKIEFDFQQKQKKLVEGYEDRKTTMIKDNEERKKTVVDRATKDAETKKQQMILKTRSAMRLAVLKKRQEFADKIMDEVKKRAGIFVGTAEYVKFLKEAIKQVLSKFSADQFINFSFSRDDLKNNQKVILSTIKSFRDEATYKIETVDSLIGGVFVKSGDGRLEIDFTINTILGESNQLVGEILYSWLNKE